MGLIKDNPVTLNVVQSNFLQIFFAELVFTFALCFVILYVATYAKTRGNYYYGVAIGLTVVIGAYAVGAVSGGAFNPAVALGMAVMGLSATMNLWVYLAANFTGGILAAVVYKKLNPEDI